MNFLAVLLCVQEVGGILSQCVHSHFFQFLIVHLGREEIQFYVFLVLTFAV